MQFLALFGALFRISPKVYHQKMFRQNRVPQKVQKRYTFCPKTKYPHFWSITKIGGKIVKCLMLNGTRYSPPSGRSFRSVPFVPFAVRSVPFQGLGYVFVEVFKKRILYGFWTLPQKHNSASGAERSGTLCNICFYGRPPEIRFFGDPRHSFLKPILESDKNHTFDEEIIKKCIKKCKEMHFGNPDPKILESDKKCIFG